jgi:hypothetical protein
MGDSRLFSCCRYAPLVHWPLGAGAGTHKINKSLRGPRPLTPNSGARADILGRRLGPRPCGNRATWAAPAHFAAAEPHRARQRTMVRAARARRRRFCHVSRKKPRWHRLRLIQIKVKNLLRPRIVLAVSRNGSSRHDEAAAHHPRDASLKAQGQRYLSPER